MFVHLVKTLGVGFTGIGSAIHRPYNCFPKHLAQNFKIKC
jgi:hypothetical protein